jgi:hypothetical protein
MAEENSIRFERMANAPGDDGSPRMVVLVRANREVAAVGAADADDAARQVAILVLQQEDGLRIGDEVRISRI